MKKIVITGSTRGIGYGLANSFLALGWSVAVSGRTQEGVEAAVSSLATRHDAGSIVGQPCDVTRFDQVQALWDVAQARFGGIDMWVNNAGQLGTALTKAALLDLRNTMNKANAHVEGRRLVLTPDSETDLLNLDAFTEVDKIGTTAGVVQAALGRKFNFDIYT